MSDSPWVRFKEIEGGTVVFCKLCGKKFARTFMAKHSNHAEARRSATAYHWNHEHSVPHCAALDAFHADVAPPDLDAILLHSEPRPERALRLEAAREAARRAARANP